MKKIEQFCKKVPRIKKEPDWTLFSLMIAAAAVRLVVFAIKACLVEGGIIHIIILLVASFVLADA